MALLKDKILVVIGHVKTQGAGSLVVSRAKEVEDNGDGKAVQIALEDLQTHLDHLTSVLSVMAGESLSTLAETVVEKPSGGRCCPDLKFESNPCIRNIIG